LAKKTRELIERARFLHESGHLLSGNLSRWGNSGECKELILREKEGLRDAYATELSSPRTWLEVFDGISSGSTSLHCHAELPAFSEAFDPYLSWIEGHLAGADPNIVRAAVHDFVARASRLSQYCLYAEFKSYSSAKSASPKTNYESFVHNVAQDRWRSIANQYPVLTRLVCELARNCARNALILHRRICTDRHDIEEFFDVDLSKLGNVVMGLSDPHGRGASVAKITTTSGKNIFYKPRCTLLETWFNQHLKCNFASSPFLHFACLSRQQYGWQEDAFQRLQIVGHSGFEREEVFGAAAALMCLLNTTDLHAENVLHGKGWIAPIDLETVLGASPTHSSLVEPRWRSWTVLSTDLFDNCFGVKGINQSPSGFFPKEITPFAPIGSIVRCVNEGVRLIVNSPNDKVIPPTHEEVKIDRLIEHQRHWFERIIEIGDSWLSDLMSISGASTRTVLRPTQVYERVWQRLTLPSMLRDGSQFHEAALRLTGVRGLGLTNQESVLVISMSESIQICNGDVPLFSKKANGRDLLDDKNHLVIPNFFTTGGIDLSKRKIAEFSATDISEQCILTNASLDLPRREEPSQLDEEKSVDEVEFFRLICAISDDLCQSAILEKSNLPKWISYNGDASGETLRAVTSDRSFYSGSLGIIFFLSAFEAYINKCQHDKNPQVSSVLDHAASAWQSSFMPTDLVPPNQSLGITGVGGTLFAASQMLEQHGRWSFLIDQVCDFSIEKEYFLNDTLIDVIGGSAGFMLGACQAYRKMKKLGYRLEKLLMSIEASFDHLYSSSKVENENRSWEILGESRPLLGYAHGSAGFISAISAAAISFQIEGDERRYERAQAMVHQARSFLLRQRNVNGVWPDLRQTAGGQPANMSWCHGLAGILQGEYSASEIGVDVNTEGLEKHLLTQIDQSKPYGTFCCGLAGGIDAMIGALDHRTLLRFASRLVESDRGDPVCKTTIGYATAATFPGLYQGLSGSGYSMLRLLDPKIPSLSLVMSSQKDDALTK